MSENEAPYTATRDTCADCAHFHAGDWCDRWDHQVEGDAEACERFVPAAPDEDYRWREANRQLLRDACAAKERGDKLAFDLALMAFYSEEEARLRAKAWRMENGDD
jgi:hypothetical protein